MHQNSRRWRQYSLKGLLLTLLVASIGLAMLVHHAKQHHRIIAELKELRVAIEERRNESSASPEWLRGLVREDLLGVTYAASISGDPTSDQLRQLKRLHGLELVRVESPRPYNQIDSVIESMRRELPGNTSLSISTSDQHILFSGSIHCDFP